MLVYRVEDAFCSGPYVGSHTVDLSHTYMNDEYPSPSRDGISFDSNIHRFAFASEEALNRWFGPDVRAGLHRDGFMMATYDVPPEAVRYGKKQLVFEYDLARLIERRDLRAVSEAPVPLAA